MLDDDPTDVVHGHLDPPDAAPVLGERRVPVVATDAFVVEQILSGTLDEPVDFDQDHDEWVLLVAGGATLEAAGESHELTAGDWMFLPARTPHRLVSTEPGTGWLAVTERR